MADRRRPPVVLFIIPMLLGVVGFVNVTQRPQFESYRAVDVVQLTGSGACFGAAIVGLFVMLLRSHT